VQRVEQLLGSEDAEIQPPAAVTRSKAAVTAAAPEAPGAAAAGDAAEQAPEPEPQPGGSLESEALEDPQVEMARRIIGGEIAGVRPDREGG
jgi:hypothetical protein